MPLSQKHAREEGKQETLLLPSKTCFKRNALLVVQMCKIIFGTVLGKNTQCGLYST